MKPEQKETAFTYSVGPQVFIAAHGTRQHLADCFDPDVARLFAAADVLAHALEQVVGVCDENDDTHEVLRNARAAMELARIGQLVCTRCAKPYPERRVTGPAVRYMCAGCSKPQLTVVPR